MKVGDKVWVQVEITAIHGDDAQVMCDPASNSNNNALMGWVNTNDCRPVEPDPVIEQSSPTESDAVNHPSHYNQGSIECIEAIKAATGEGFVSYIWGNILKYLWRWPKKNGVEDLKKARWYLDRLIKEVDE